MKLYFIMHVCYFNVFVYEIQGEIAYALSVQIETKYGWLLCGKFRN